jgi:hypothetical protein
MTNKPNRVLDFVHKTLSIKQNAHWKERDFTTLVVSAASRNTYVETVNSKAMPNADTLHYRIEKDTSVNDLQSCFLQLTRKQLRKVRGKAIVIIDYTYEPFFGYTQNEWVHGYNPAKGSRGCFKILAASVVVNERRYFIYAKPVSLISDEAFELLQILAHVEDLDIKIKVVLVDRGFARDSENLAVLQDAGVKYLGLYPKYPNIKTIVGSMKRSYKNRKFRVKGVPTRLVIGKEKFTWVFVTNLPKLEFISYLRLYKRRWNIETGFRVHDEATIKTKSLDIRVRFFLFLVALVLYNAWKRLDVATSFKRFVIVQELCTACSKEIKPT